MQFLTILYINKHIAPQPTQTSAHPHTRKAKKRPWNTSNTRSKIGHKEGTFPPNKSYGPRTALPRYAYSHYPKTESRMLTHTRGQGRNTSEKLIINLVWLVRAWSRLVISNTDTYHARIELANLFLQIAKT